MTDNEAQSTHKTVHLVPKWLLARTVQNILISRRTSSPAEELLACVGDFMFWIWMIVNAAVCLSWHTNSDMSGIDLCGGLSLARFGSLHVNRVVYLWVLRASMRATGLEQDLTNVFVSQTVEYRVQQRAACRRQQGGVGVQGRAGCIS